MTHPQTPTPSRPARRWWQIVSALALAAVVAAGCGQPPAASAPTAAPTVAPTTPPAPPTVAAVPTEPPAAAGPEVLAEGITMRKVLDIDGGAIRLGQSPKDGAVYLLHPENGLFRLKLDDPGDQTRVATKSDMVGEAVPSGMAFGPDGTLFVVANRTVDETKNEATIRKGTPAAEGFTWTTVAATEPYPLSGTQFDHLANGIAVSPDGKWIFYNSGSRTDHGEVQDNKGAFPDTREVPLTSAIMRVPADANDLKLPADEAALKEYLFADGTRNAYDMAFAPDGQLFAIDNGPDADYADELNAIVEGKHYGFPWRFGDQDNPQQFPGYDSSKDKRLNQDFMAVQNGTYKDDPTFPKAPGAFADPVANRGPDATQYRAEDGSAREAADEKQALHTFTPHRSPLGLVFAPAEVVPATLRGDGDATHAFVLSWGAAGGTLSDAGQDLLHLALKKSGDSYETTTTQIARSFNHPIDAVLIDNRLYVLEFGNFDGKKVAIWELTFAA